MPPSLSSWCCTHLLQLKTKYKKKYFSVFLNSSARANFDCVCVVTFVKYSRKRVPVVEISTKPCEMCGENICYKKQCPSQCTPKDEPNLGTKLWLQLASFSSWRVCQKYRAIFGERFRSFFFVSQQILDMMALSEDFRLGDAICSYQTLLPIYILNLNHCEEPNKHLIIIYFINDCQTLCLRESMIRRDELI